MRTVLVVITLAFIAITCFAESFDFSNVDIPRTLSECIDACDVVIIGTVVHLEYVKRSISPDSDREEITTDVFVRIDSPIKGEPNLGKRHLKFMIEGGTSFSEIHDGFVTAQVGSRPTYEVRERVMLFLKYGSQDSAYYGKWPYNGLHGNVLIGDYGKLLFDDEEMLKFHYYIDSGPKRDRRVSGVTIRWGLVKR